MCAASRPPIPWSRSCVIAHLDRDPVMLYPELAQLGWEAEPIEGEPGEVRLRLRRSLS
jgi:hypothetical protein